MTVTVVARSRDGHAHDWHDGRAQRFRRSALAGEVVVDLGACALSHRREQGVVLRCAEGCAHVFISSPQGGWVKL